MARPALPAHLRRTCPVMVLLRPGEREQLERLAAARKQSLGGILRRAFLGWEEIPDAAEPDLDNEEAAEVGGEEEGAEADANQS